MDILQPGFEITVRNRFGVDEDDLTDTSINDPMVSEYAEAIIKRRVPLFATVMLDSIDTFFLQDAVISQICAILCVSMAKRVPIEVAITDIKIKNEKSNWEEIRKGFLNDIEIALGKIESVNVFPSSDPSGTGIIASKTLTRRTPIGGIEGGS
jgi:hypothetical protein